MSLQTLDRVLSKTADRSVGDLVAAYGSNVQKLKMDAAAGKIDPTKAVMAMMAIQRIVAANTQPPPGTTVAQDTGITPPPQPMMPPPAAPQQAPVQMAYGGQVAISNNQVPSPAMERGLDGIPVPDNMFDYAGGGMVAFADGGNVQRFTPGGLSALQTPYNIYQSNAPRFQETASTPSGGGLLDYLASYPERRKQEAAAEAIRVREALANPNLPGMARVELVTKLNSLEKELGRTTPLTRENTPIPDVLVNAGLKYAEDRNRFINSPEAIAKAQNQPKLDPVAAAIEKSKQDVVRQPSSELINVGSSFKPRSATDIMAEMKAGRGDEGETVEQYGRRVGERVVGDAGYAVPEKPTLRNMFTQMSEADVAAGVDPKFFEKMQGRLDSMREEAKTDKKEAANLRLLEAGLGILGGTSPYAFVNIGKGASEAVKGFGQDLKDFQKARKELDRAEMDLRSAEQTAARSKSQKAMDMLESREIRRDNALNKVADAKVAAVNSAMSTFMRGKEIESADTRTAAQLASSESMAKAQLDMQGRQLSEQIKSRVENARAQLGVQIAANLEKSLASAAKPFDERLDILRKSVPFGMPYTKELIAEMTDLTNKREAALNLVEKRFLSNTSGGASGGNKFPGFVDLTGRQ